MLRAHPASSRELTLHLFLHNHKKFARSLHSKPKQAIEGNDLVKISLEAFSRRASSLCGSTGCAVILLADWGMAGVRMWQLLRQQFVFAQDGNPPPKQHLFDALQKNCLQSQAEAALLPKLWETDCRVLCDRAKKASCPAESAACFGQ